MSDISPVVLSYLKTLSRKDLIELIHSFMLTHEDIRLAIEEKAAVQATKNENEAAADKQQIPQTAANALVNRNSTAQEKINLYTSLFIGRQDVFALRWYNAKSNKSGYSPVCENKWKTGKCDMKKYACAACPFKLPMPLSDRYIFNHLAGKDSTCRDVVGLYPLMEGDVCRFLAFDFDSHTGNSDTWKKDAAAVCKTCAAFSIPVSVEISRSGKGAHLWIFFNENISAKRARNLGMLILQAAMNERHSLPFESFDRMFPNQDSIPKGGYGNLIALPLQGQAVKNKCSVFVDEDFIPFNDQWAYLSSVKKLSAKDLETCCIEITKVVHDFLPKTILPKTEQHIKFPEYCRTIQAVRTSNQTIRHRKMYNLHKKIFLRLCTLRFQIRSKLQKPKSRSGLWVFSDGRRFS